MTRVFALAGLLAVAVLPAAAAPSAAAPAPTQVPVYFVRGEQLAPVTRPGATAEDAVRRLLAGPTPAEAFRRGFRAYIAGGHPAPGRGRGRGTSWRPST